MWDKTSGFARYLQAHDSSLSRDLHLQIQTATFHITAASKSFNERDSAIVVSQIESRYPMSKIQKKTSFNFFPFAFPENVSQKWRGRGTDLLSTTEWRGASEFSSNRGKTFEKFSRQWTIPGAVKLKSHGEAISQQFLSILISWTYL